MQTIRAFLLFQIAIGCTVAFGVAGFSQYGPAFKIEAQAADREICVGSENDCKKSSSSTLQKGSSPAEMKHLDFPATSKAPKEAAQLKDIEPDGPPSSKIAMVVGESKYQFVPELPNPTNDANLVAETLRQIGYEVIVAIDVSQLGFDDILKSFIAKASKKEAAIFYYAGHAFQYQGDNYLVTIDAELSSEKDIVDHSIKIDEILHLLQRTVSTKIIVLDACRNEVARNNTQSKSRGVGVPGLAPMKVTEIGTYIMYSTSPGEVSFDGEGPNSPFANAFAEALKENPDRDVEDFFRSVRGMVVENTHGQQVPWSVSLMIDHYYMRNSPSPPSSPLATLNPSGVKVEPTLLAELGSSPLEINGKRFEDVAKIESETNSGSDSIFRRGLNTISAAGRKLSVWYESGDLSKFEEPYRNSYAIVVAIDRYSASDTAGINHQNLGFMVKNAAELVSELKRFGFPADHILFLSDEAATSKKINDTLQEFWKGGKFDTADRLLFYFGGHGEKLPNDNLVDPTRQEKGVLVTFDFDSKSPALTGLLLDDIINRHSRYIVARHVLFLIDACSAGLLLPRYQKGEENAEERAHLRKLAMLRQDIKKPVREFLLAGTGEEKALWMNGGIFTQAVIEGLKGKADWAGDGLIEFDELSLQVRNAVRSKADETGVDQVPAEFHVGDGRFVFVKP
jgi:uncharacterized caspase-like protein